MINVNKVIITGFTTDVPEFKTTATGKNVANFTVATNFTWKDKAGEKQKKAEFHKVVVWGKLADIVMSYVKKGAHVYVEGRLETRSWEQDNGKLAYRTEIIADAVNVLDRVKTNA